MSSDWKDLVKRAKSDNADFEGLVSKLEPLFLIIAKHLSGGRLVDDLIQIARIRVWKALPMVDLRRLGTIKQFLITVGVNGMINETKRQSRQLMVSYGDSDNRAVAVAPSEDRYLFRGLLLGYKRYIERNGSFKGAHKYMARKCGVSLWTIRRRFHRTAHQFLEGLEK